MTETSSSLASLRRYGVLLRRQWWVVLVVTVLAVAVSVVYVHRKPSVYEAQMKIVVGQGQALFVPNVSNAVQPFTQTMTDLIQSDIVARKTIEQLHLDVTPSVLVSKLSVSSPPEASVLQVSYEDTNRIQGRRILETAGHTFTALIDKQTAGSASAGSTTESVEAQANGSEPVSATVFEPAHYVPGAISPKPARTIAIAAVLGLIAGILLAILRDGLANRIRSEDEAERAYQAPLVGAIPRGVIGATPAQVSLMPARLSTAVSEALEVLCATLRYGGSHPEQGIILVTSAEPEEGKSTLSSLIAATIARSGYATAIVDADLRRATLHRFLGVTPRRGLADVLAGDASLGDALVAVNQQANVNPTVGAASSGVGRPGRSGYAPTPASGVSPTADLLFLAAGTREQSPAKVLSLGNSAELIAQLRGFVDYIVIDTAPLLLSGDAFPLVQLADIVVVASRERQSTREHALALSQRLGALGVKEFSVVLTEASSSRLQSYGYGY